MASLAALLDDTDTPTHSTKQPYAPTRRVSPADSVLIPISRVQLVQSQSSANPLRTRSSTHSHFNSPLPPPPPASATPALAGLPPKPQVPLPPKPDRLVPAAGGGGGVGGGRKRPLQQQFDPEEEARKRAKASLDTRTVAEHYNARPNTNVKARDDSPIIGLKRFNNWVKSVLIAKHGRREDAATPKVRVLDLGCGKGGDLPKWSKAGTAEYVGIDLAVVSVEQARDRYQNMRGVNFPASFFALDCFESPITEVLDPSYFEPNPFDVVSLQFCMHYALETEEKARRMLDNVSRFLRPGGVFVGTIPDANNLLYVTRLPSISFFPLFFAPSSTKVTLSTQYDNHSTHLDDALTTATESGAINDDPSAGLAFGNSVYNVKFDQREWDSPYGHRYTFFLQDAVEEVPEYVVYWENFVALAAEYNLHPVYCADFQTIFADEQEDAHFAQLLRRMKVMDEEGNAEMDEDQLDAAMLYLGFAFVKQ